MKAIFINTKWLTSVGGMLLACIVGLHATGYFSSQGRIPIPEKFNVKSATDSNDAATHVIKLYISPSEFSNSDQNSKNESLNQTFCSSLCAFKLLRCSLFDAEQSSVLSQRLTWYTQSTYTLLLSPFWQPSIPIAHRKLII